MHCSRNTALLGPFRGLPAFRAGIQYLSGIQGLLYQTLQHHMTPGHGEPPQDPRHCTLWYHQVPGCAGPSAQVIVLPGDICSFSEQQYPFVFPGGGTKDRAQHPKPALYRMEQGLLQPGPHTPSNVPQKSHQETATQSSSTPLRFTVSQLCEPAFAVPFL